MKKISVIALALVASLVLVGCGSSSSHKNNQNQEQNNNGGNNADNNNNGGDNNTDNNGDNGGNNADNNNNGGDNNADNNGDNANNNTDNGTKGTTSITIGDDPKNVYGYKISGKFSNAGVTATVVTTFNCDGSNQSVQVITGGGHSETHTHTGGTDNAPTLKEGLGSTAGKTILSWTYDTDTAGDYYILTDDKKIVVGVTKVSGAKQSSITKIEKVETCQ